MSALANTRINQSKTHDGADNSVEDDMVDLSTTAVSVTARIDYIQRFSKQMTVVVDKNTVIYSKVARQYLANLSQESSKQEMNVAFVAASSKINDIQMRCRLIEQLFANTLFDPEQSLAVSILRLAKQNNGIITVVVEHAQALSLQIKYELCQLVDTAKKTQNNINVVIFGLEQAAIEISQNRTIFDKKTSIIDASNGQVLALDHARFKNKTPVFKKDLWIKVSLATLSSLLIAVVFWFILSEHESFNFTALPIEPLVNDKPIIVPKKVSTQIQNNNLASVSDVHVALVSQNRIQDLQPVKAERNDILQALMLAEPIAKDNQIAENYAEIEVISANGQVTPKQVNLNNEKLDKVSQSTKLPLMLNEQYYLDSEKGYVVQVTGFGDLLKLEQFINQYNEIDYFSYQRNLNGQKFFVLTSKIFSDKTQAREALSKLPPAISNLGAFLKSVSTIKHEINTVSQ
jgi:DamX protein